MGDSGVAELLHVNLLHLVAEQGFNRLKVTLASRSYSLVNLRMRSLGL